MIFKIKTNNIRNGLSVIRICMMQSIQLSQLNAGYILMGSYKNICNCKYHKHLLKVYCDVFYTSYIIGSQLKVLTVKKQIFKLKQLSKIYSM